MGKKYFFLVLFLLIVFAGNAQKFLSDENVIYLSDLVAPAAINAVDLDGDGDIDIIAALEDKIFWYENIGGNDIFGPLQNLITLTTTLRSLYTIDLNNDGYPDILAALDNKIGWYENTGVKGVFGPWQLIDTFSNEVQYIFAADLDGDDDNDVITATRDDNKLIWFENTDGQASFSLKQIITTSADFVQSIFTADLDGDEDMDILTASAFDDKIAWYENTDGMGSFGEQKVITTSADYARYVYAADLDGDGDIDVLSASAADDKIAWYENTDGSGTFSQQKVIAVSADYPQYVYAADLDGDGDNDVFSASFFDNKVAWYENIDSLGTFGPEHIITKTADQAGFVWAGDLDGDGDFDVITASCDFKIAWHENTLPLKILQNPVSSFIYPDSVINFNIVANEHAGNFQWQLNSGNGFSDLSNSEIYSGVNTDSLQIGVFNPAMSGYEYRCIVSYSDKMLASDKAVVIQAPVDQNIEVYGNCQAVLPDYTKNLNYSQLPPPYAKISGTTKVTLTSKNTTGNAKPVSFYVGVTDHTAPVLASVPSNHTLEPNSDGKVFLPNYLNIITVTDNCSKSNEIVKTQSPSAFTLITDGLTVVTIVATDGAGNSSQASFNVELEGFDITPPVITSTHNNQILEANENCQAILPNYINNVVATDNKNWPSELKITQTPTPWSLVSGAVNPVTLTVTDKAGNSTLVTFNVNVTDKIKPVIACIPNQNILLEEGKTTYNVPGTALDPVTFYDNCSIAGIINTFNNSSSLEGAVFPPGTTNIIWILTDAAGNITQCNFNLTVNLFTRVETLNQIGIFIYPNPSEGIFYYKTSDHSILSMNVIDLTGKIVIDKSNLSEEGTIDLSGYSDGIYFFSIITTSRKFIIKMVKE